MTSATWSVALLGGAGAFLGAGLGQSIQWARDRWQAGLDRQKERRAAVRKAYVKGARILTQLESGLIELTYMSARLGQAAEVDDEAGMRTEMQDSMELLQRMRELTRSTDYQDLNVYGGPVLRKAVPRVPFYLDRLGPGPLDPNAASVWETVDTLQGILLEALAEIRREVLLEEVPTAPARPAGRAGRLARLRRR